MGLKLSWEQVQWWSSTTRVPSNRNPDVNILVAHMIDNHGYVCVCHVLLYLCHITVWSLHTFRLPIWYLLSSTSPPKQSDIKSMLLGRWCCSLPPRIHMQGYASPCNGCYYCLLYSYLYIVMLIETLMSKVWQHAVYIFISGTLLWCCKQHKIHFLASENCPKEDLLWVSKIALQGT